MSIGDDRRRGRAHARFFQIERRTVKFAVLMFLLVWIGPLAKSSQPKPIAWIGAGVKIYYDASGREYLHVQHIIANGPAAHSGMLPGDLVRSIDGQPVVFGDYVELGDFLADRKPGERLVLRGFRNGAPLTLLVVVGVMPDSARSAWERSMSIARQLRDIERSRKPSHSRQ